MNESLLPDDKLPGWFTYPNNFITAVESGLLDVGQWQILTGDWLLVRLEGLKKRFPDRHLVPFARRLDSDDIACWEQDSPTEVRIVHDFAAPGWEERERYPSFDAWVRAAKSEGPDFDT
jgi:hypothetical protein